MSAIHAYKDLLATDTFEVALAADACVLAYQRRTFAGRLVHREVDVRTLTQITRAIDPLTLPAGIPLYERILHIERMIHRLSTKKRSELVDAVVEDYRRTPWRPMRGPQAAVYELSTEVDIVLAAGGGGSGKTEAALGAALFLSRAARFLRRTSMEFTPLIQRIGQLVGSTEGRNLSTGTWQLPPPFGWGGRGCTIEMTSVNDPDSHLRAQGRAVDGLFPDDVGNAGVSEASLFFIANWLRTSEAGLPRKFLMTANPPSNADALWVKDYFAPWVDEGYEGTPAASGEVRYFLPKGDSAIEVPAGTPDSQSRVVVMSTVHCNPRLLHTGYEKQLKNSPTDLLRRRLLENDWLAGWDSDDDLQAIPSSYVDAAMARWQPEPPSALDAIGIDVARGGKDRSTIARRHGNWFNAPIVIPGSETPNGQSLAARVLGVYTKGAAVMIDVTGVGSSPFDILREKVPTSGVVFGAGTHELDATQSFGFVNVRSLLWWRFRELVMRDDNPIALPPDQLLRRELCTPRYELRSGRLFVEDRASIIKRSGRSPDIATALVLAAIDTGSTIGARHAHDLMAALRRSNAKWRHHYERP